MQLLLSLTQRPGVCRGNNYPSLVLAYSHRLLPVFRRHPERSEGPPYWLLPLLLLLLLLLPLLLPLLSPLLLPLPSPFWLSSRRDLLLLLLLLSQLLLHLR